MMLVPTMMLTGRETRHPKVIESLNEFLNELFDA